MRRIIIQYVRWGVLVLLYTILGVSCKKDKIPVTVPDSVPTKWEKIAGTYDVYDTTGVYLYEMTISHLYNSEMNHDSLKFENFDGEFHFTVKQENFSNYPDMLIRIGYHPLLFDSEFNRWKILHQTDEVYNNVLSGDTLKMIFGKTNINYWIEDVVPYYACDCKQIAVKQH
jgi:hypothetical protein